MALCLWRLRRTAWYETGATCEVVEKKKELDQQDTLEELEDLMAEKEQQLLESRPYAKEDEQLFHTIERLDHLPEDTTIAEHAFWILVQVNGVIEFHHTDEFFDLYDHGFLAWLGVPAEYYRYPGGPVMPTGCCLGFFLSYALT